MANVLLSWKNMFPRLVQLNGCPLEVRRKITVLCSERNNRSIQLKFKIIETNKYIIGGILTFMICIQVHSMSIMQVLQQLSNYVLMLDFC